MGGCLLYFAVATIATLSATELVRVIALRLGALDSPGGRRVHRRPTARLGGLGIFWGFAVALLLAVYTNSSAHAALDASGVGAIGLLAGAGLMLITGLLDDVRGMGAPTKLFVQIAAATLVYLSGWRLEYIGIPGVGSWALGDFSLPLTVGWIVFATNAINLIDGLDGLASGIALIAAIAVFALVGPDVGSGVIAIALAGALLGFLWFNLSPALIFMGDAGSLFVGFAIATLTLRCAVRMGPEAFPVLPLLILAVPIADTTSAIVRRVSAAARTSRSAGELFHEARRRVFTADRGHLHHRLLDAGLPARTAVAVLHGTAIPFAIAAWLVQRQPIAGAVVAVATAIAANWTWRIIEARALNLANDSVSLTAEAALEPEAATPAAWAERDAA